MGKGLKTKKNEKESEKWKENIVPLKPEERCFRGTGAKG